MAITTLCEINVLAAVAILNSYVVNNQRRSCLNKQAGGIPPILNVNQESTKDILKL